MINWHRLFGLALTDFFTNTGYTVELEKDLSLKQQFLDVIIIQQAEDVHLSDVPDGLENLARYNLLTYKSLHETLDGWVLDELIGHYVNYRKHISPALDQLLPITDFRLYAVCTRTPQKLQQETPLQNQQPGVYEIQWGAKLVRVIVLSEMPRTPSNALWDLFSDVPSSVQYGAAQYHWHRQDLSTILNQLYQRYAKEGIRMPYTIEDYHRDLAEEYLQTHKDEVLQQFSLEERLKGVSPEDLLKRLSPEDIEAYLQKVRQHGLN